MQGNMQCCKLEAYADVTLLKPSLCYCLYMLKFVNAFQKKH
jgi:hypothetical protein